MYGLEGIELVRKFALLLKYSIKSKPAGILETISFIFRYVYWFFCQNEKVPVYIQTREFGKLWIRTRASDLEVFFQHFIYDELLSPKILSLQKITSILDLGGNIGFASVILAKLFPGAKIISIEVEKANYEMLELNCKALIESGQLQALYGAFYTRKDVHLDIIEGSLGDWNFYISERPVEIDLKEEGCEIYTIGDVASMFGNKMPDFIKMDIEGGEVACLEDDNWCNIVLQNSHLILELHTFRAYDLYFHQLRKNNILHSDKIGEYWMTKSE